MKIKIKNLLLISLLILVLIFSGCTKTSTNVNKQDNLNKHTTNNVKHESQNVESHTEINSTVDTKDITSGIIDNDSSVEIGSLI